MIGRLIVLGALCALCATAHAAPLYSLNVSATAAVSNGLHDMETISEVNGRKHAFATASVSGTGMGPVYGSASAFADANLAMGQLKARAFGTFRCLEPNSFCVEGAGSAEAQYRETLRLSLPGADPLKISRIGLRVNVDGRSVWNPEHSHTQASYHVGLTTQSGLLGAMTFTSDRLGLHQFDTGWTSIDYDFRSDPDDSSNVDLVITGFFNMVGPILELSLVGQLNAVATAGAVTDYSHTAGVSLLLPDGMSMSSASGVFLTGAQAVPEPSTSALIALGLLGFAARRRVSNRQ